MSYQVDPEGVATYQDPYGTAQTWQGTPGVNYFPGDQDSAKTYQGENTNQYQSGMIGRGSQEQHVCPACGYCPCCGRRVTWPPTYPMTPVYPPPSYPWYPAYSNPWM